MPTGMSIPSEPVNALNPFLVFTFVDSLQIADVVNSMKDLMDFCRDQKKGPMGEYRYLSMVSDYSCPGTHTRTHTCLRIW